MPERVHELFDEFEKLLGEIPSATVNSNTEDLGVVINPPKNLKSVSFEASNELARSIYATPEKGTFTSKLLKPPASLSDEKLSVHKLHQSTIKRAQLIEENLRNHQTLASVFQDLNINRPVMPSPSPSFVSPTPCNEHSLVFNGQHPNNFKKVDSPLIFLPSPQTPYNPNGFDFNGQQFVNQQGGYCQSFENFNGAVPLTAPSVQGFHLLPNAAFPATEVPMIPNQQQSEMHTPYRNIDDEHHYQLMHQQYLYMQQLRESQILESQSQPQPMQPSQTTCQACNQEPFWKNGANQRRTNLSNHRVADKILARSHGLSHIKFANYFTPRVDFHLNHIDQNQPLQKHNDDFGMRIYSMAKDQQGCRFLQRKFSEGTREDLENIFRAIIVHIVELMTDPYGNYLVQKLLEVCDNNQHMQILHMITRKPGDLVRISCDMHGTRAVQKVIETLKTPEQCSMVISSLKPGMVSLIKNMNGNHVAQRFLQYLKPEFNEFLFEAATVHCVELATDRHGCCVLQKCLSQSDTQQRQRLACEIASNALILSQDQYGNYVVQYVFGVQVPWATADILDQLQGNHGDLAIQKYSSNVVEKCLKYAGEERRRMIIDELMPHLDQIMHDPYGNFVIQAALNFSKMIKFKAKETKNIYSIRLKKNATLTIYGCPKKIATYPFLGALRDALVEAIRPHVPALRTSPYGKKVLSSNGLKK